MTTPQSVALSEYEKRSIDCPPPTVSDLRLAERLSSGSDIEPRLEVRWLHTGGAEVSASSWVGVVRFSNFEIQVVPKLVGGSLAVLRMLEYIADVRLIKRLPDTTGLRPDGDDLFDLIVLLLVEETRALIRAGLIRNYRPVDESLDVMRGRLRIRDQYLRRYGQLHTLECHFDEYDGDIPDNQLLAAATGLAGTSVRDTNIRTNARITAGILREVCEPPIRHADWYDRAIVYDRRNARYKPAHELAKLVLKGQAFNDLFSASNENNAAFLLDMNTIFERFATRLMTESLAGSELRAIPQQSVHAVIINEQTGTTYSNIRPDVIIEDTRTGDRVPLDVKYKLYDSKKLSSTDIYQSFVYAYAINTRAATPQSGLLYPSASTSGGVALHVKPVGGVIGARIRSASLDVPAVLDAMNGHGQRELHDRVCAMVREVTGFDMPA